MQRGGSAYFREDNQLGPMVLLGVCLSVYFAKISRRGNFCLPAQVESGKATRSARRNSNCRLFPFADRLGALNRVPPSICKDRSTGASDKCSGFAQNRDRSSI